MVKWTRSVLAGVTLASFAGVAGAAGCEVVVGLDKSFHATGSGGGTTSSGTSTSSGSGGSTTSTTMPCVLSHAPDPPGGADSADKDDFVVALHTINLGEMDFTVKFGLDLDNLCTCLNKAPGSCKAVANEVCDGPGGIDNALGIIFATVHQISSGIVTSGQLNKAASDGVWTVLLRIRGYNGKPDDPTVEVDSYMTQGSGADMSFKPKWDGSDAWPVDDASLADGKTLDTPVLKDAAAYVSNNVLVAHLKTLTMRIRGPLFGMDIDLDDMLAVATIDPAAHTLTNGILTGKWPLSVAFKDLSTIRYAGSQKICTSDPNYTAVKQAICGTTDLRLDGMSGTCDTLSFGALFTADPAMLGMVVPAAGPPMNGCSPDKDPATDMCN